MSGIDSYYREIKYRMHFLTARSLSSQAYKKYPEPTNWKCHEQVINLLMHDWFLPFHALQR